MKMIKDFDMIAIETIQTIQCGNPYTRLLILGKYRSPLFATIHPPHPMF